MANRRFIDFPIAASVGDNDIVLIWQDGLNKQTTKATLLQGSPQSLAGLTDVDIAGLTNGQILQYNSTLGKWENVDRTDINLSELGDVTIVAPTNGQVLVYNSSTSKWENSSGGYVPYTGAVTTVNLGAQTIQAGSFVKAGGTSAQFLKANGSVDSTAYGTGSVTSVGLTMPSAFSVANSPVTTAGTLTVTGAGTVAQYIRGDGSLADFPESSGGGSSVSYYLNGSISQGTIGGVAYRELSKVPILGAGTDFTINADGYIASFITDAGDPNLLEIPGGNWNLETYFSASSGGGSPTFYVELYKVNSGGTATLIASNSGSPELIAFGTNLTAYFSSLAVPTTTLALTDRLAIRYYVAHSGRTITMHTENNHLCQIITTFTTGLTALNGLTAQVQNFATGTTGTDFNIASATATHTFNLPTASGTNRGALSSTDWTTFNNKENAITAGTTAQYFRGDKTFQTLNTSVVPEGTNLYYTEARVNANTNVAANTAARHNAVTLGTANGLSLSTQVLSLGLASAGVTGALSGTDWTTFNNKQNALTNPVTGTGTTNYLAKFTGSTTVGNSQVFDNGTNVGIGTTLPGTKLETLSLHTSDVIPTSGLGGSTTNAFITQSYGLLIGTTYTVGTAWLQSKYRDFTGTLPMSLQPLGGNVGIGTTSPNRLLTVSGTQGLISLNATSYRNTTIGSDSVGNFIVYDDTAAAYRMVINSSGNVGIGTTSPQDYSGFNTLTINGKSGSSGGVLRLTAFDNSSSFNIYAAGSAANFNTTSSIDFLWYTQDTERMRLKSNGNLLVGTTTDGGARLQIVSTGIALNMATSNGQMANINSTNANGGYITWQTSGTTIADIGTAQQIFGAGGNEIFGINGRGARAIAFGTNDTERMRITSSGNVGIGTSSGFNFVSGTERTLSIANSNVASLYLNSTSTGNLYALYSSASGVFQIYNATQNNYPLAITSGANVLIGTTTDVGYKLHVNGNLNLSIGGNRSIRIGSATNYYYDLQSTNDDFQIIEAGTTPRLTIKYPNGNVGIGTNSPSSKLDVIGVFRNIMPDSPSAPGSITSKILSYSISPYGLVFRSSSSGLQSLQSQRESNDAETFGISLNPNGGNILIGTTTDNGNKLRVNGVGFFDQGVRTGQPVGTTTNNWLLGRALASGTSTPDRWIRVQIGLEYYDILAVYMGTL